MNDKYLRLIIPALPFFGTFALGIDRSAKLSIVVVVIDMKDCGLYSLIIGVIGDVGVWELNRIASTVRMKAGSCSLASICDCDFMAFKARMKAGSRSFNSFKASGDFGVEHLSGDGVRVPSEIAKVRVHKIPPCWTG
jgi:hypothetical protein